MLRALTTGLLPYQLPVLCCTRAAAQALRRDLLALTKDSRRRLQRPSWSICAYAPRVTQAGLHRHQQRLPDTVHIHYAPHEFDTIFGKELRKLNAQCGDVDADGRRWHDVPYAKASLGRTFAKGVLVQDGLYDDADVPNDKST